MDYVVYIDTPSGSAFHERLVRFSGWIIDSGRGDLIEFQLNGNLQKYVKFYPRQDVTELKQGREALGGSLYVDTHAVKTADQNAIVFNVLKNKRIVYDGPISDARPATGCRWSESSFSSFTSLRRAERR